jgi:sarcosine oxidase subunit alpha
MAAADGSIAAVRVGPHAADRAGAAEDIACDLLAVSGGWDPNVGIVTHTTGRLGWEEALGTFVPRGLPPGVHVAGGAAGDFDAGACIESGYDAGERAVRALGRAVAARSMAARPSAAVPDPAVPLFIVPAASPEEETRQYVDLHRDATVADLRRAVGAGLRSIEHVKRYTLVGTAPDQGRTSGVLSAAITAGLLGVSPGDLGTTTARPPQVPVTFAALAGRDRGTRFDPERVTAIHDRHVAAGAVFEPVGQWLRARFYPLPGEDMEAAVQRECAAVRERVGMADVSTLGKIDVRGPDAGEFLDRVYTGAFSTLAPGRARYGLMLRLDGMLFDDGVTTRLAPDHFQMTTTTGNAAAVMDWLEEWLQTEWPDLRVHCASVTEQWAVVAVAGPRSRDVMAALAPGLDVTAAGFPFMTVQESTVAGLPARIFRISFSGELAYEVNVEWWHGQALWDAVGEAGRPHGIVPYGTESMHVLRAEKGYFIVGQETDGSVTPVDLGLEGMLSTRKDFLGRRSLRRPDLLRPDRKQLVGLLPLEPDALLVEGSQLVADARVPPPVPMLGHVTASYRSSALGRTFALALVKGGRSRHGEVIQAVHLGAITEARITSPLFYDPEDRRRDG